MHVTLLRISIPLIMMLAHGLPKLQKFSLISDRFPDPLGLGSELSLILVIFAEFICPILIILGISTRLACIPIIIDMSVATFIFHATHSFQKKELSLIFLLCFLCIFLAGSGKFSLKLPKIKTSKPWLNWLFET